MKKIIQLTVAAVFSFVLFTGGAAAQEGPGCYITNTGPDSNNECVNTENLSCQVLNNTIISINNNNVQVSESGDGEGDNNTSVTYVVTGPASNDNSAVVNGTIVNGSCVPAVAETPGQGSGTPEVPAAAVTPAAVAQLPKTSSASPLTYVAAVMAVVVAAAVASRLSVAVYSVLKK